VARGETLRFAQGDTHVRPRRTSTGSGDPPRYVALCGAIVRNDQVKPASEDTGVLRLPVSAQRVPAGRFRRPMPDHGRGVLHETQAPGRQEPAVPLALRAARLSVFDLAFDLGLRAAFLAPPVVRPFALRRRLDTRGLAGEPLPPRKPRLLRSRAFAFRRHHGYSILRTRRATFRTLPGCTWTPRPGPVIARTKPP